MHYKNLLTLNKVDKYTLLSNNDDDRIKIDNRFFASYRPSYNIDKTIFILRNSFMYFLKIYELEHDMWVIPDICSKPSILPLITNASDKLKLFNENQSYNDKDKEKIMNLYKFIHENILVINNKFNDEKPEYNINSENIKYKNAENQSYLSSIIDSFYEKIYVVKDFLETSLDYILKTIFT